MITKQEFITALRCKIDSKEKLDDLLRAAGCTAYIGKPASLDPSVSSKNYDVMSICDRYGIECLSRVYRIHPSRWWVIREELRFSFGVYTTMPQLEESHEAIATLMTHPSLEDRMLVAYTPSIEAGEQDKQRVTTLSRLLRQFSMHLPEDAFRDLEAQYRSEMSDELTILTGADIAKAYDRGPQSCMSNDGRYWTRDGIGGHHVADVWDGAPGVGVAVMVKPSDPTRYSARCMVYTNPDDPTDKRWLRLYGDTALKRRLEVNGYRCTSFAGVRMKRIDIDEYKVVMPYIDSTNKANCGESVMLDGDGWLRIVSGETAMKFNGIVSYSARAGNATAGWISTPSVVGEDQLFFTCPVSGEKTSVMKGEWAQAVFNGKLQRVSKTAVASWSPVNYWDDSRSRLVLVAVSPDTVTLDHCGEIYVESEGVRRYLGLVKLSAKYYPDQQEWVLSFDTKLVYDGEGQEAVIRVADVVQIVLRGDEAPHLRSVHKNYANFADKKTWKAATRLKRTTSLYIHKDVATVRTASNRVAVPGVHSIYKTIDGVWDFQTNLSSVRIMREYVWYSGRTPPVFAPMLPNTLAYMQQLVEQCVVARWNTPAPTTRRAAVAQSTDNFANLFRQGMDIVDGALRYTSTHIGTSPWATDQHATREQAAEELYARLGQQVDRLCVGLDAVPDSPLKREALRFIDAYNEWQDRLVAFLDSVFPELPRPRHPLEVALDELNSEADEFVEEESSYVTCA